MMPCTSAPPACAAFATSPIRPLPPPPNTSDQPALAIPAPTVRAASLKRGSSPKDEPQKTQMAWLFFFSMPLLGLRGSRHLPKQVVHIFKSKGGSRSDQSMSEGGS